MITRFFGRRLMLRGILGEGVDFGGELAHEKRMVIRLKYYKLLALEINISVIPGTCSSLYFSINTPITSINEAKG